MSNAEPVAWMVKVLTCAAVMIAAGYFGFLYLVAAR
jgi:hypothetical protein